eukprot:gb/GEZN01007482.1/.p1 GENE.gb/GEZN01007482.1/~~gb/GEZN01007482.1/.p1  ORF type:complete len:365 (-),score=65.56 gb/GEZN01007482.1/:399-1493(-)
MSISSDKSASPSAALPQSNSLPELPTKMKGVTRVIYGTDWAKVFEMSEELPVPTPGAGQVLVRVHAASIGSGEVKVAAGWLQLIIKETLPAVPGLDVAGTVVAVAGDVKRLKVGDQVFGTLGVGLQGGLAEYAVANASKLVVKPTKLSFTQAAALPVSGLITLLACQNIEAKQRVVVRGASGGVGSLVVQLAKSKGATVVGVSSNTELVKSLGADHCIDYKEQKDWVKAIEEGKEEVDVLIDCVGGAWADGSARRILKKKGSRFVAVAVDDLKEPLTIGYLVGMVGGTVNRKFWSLFGYPGYSAPAEMDCQTSSLEELSRLAEEGKLVAVIDSEVPFLKEGAVKMYATQHSGRAKGKLVMRIAQ